MDLLAAGVLGTLGGFARANWRFATFITYPHVVLLLEALCWRPASPSCSQPASSALGVPDLFSMAAAAAVFVALVGTMLKYTENHTYVLYLLSDTIWTWEFSHRQRPEWDARIDRFAQHLVNVTKASDADEIVIVGHSSGSFLGTEILARALKLDPDLGRRGSRVVLLTLGGNYPIVGFHKVSQDFRDHLRQLAIEPSIDWIDCQSRKDVMNFYQFDPIEGHGIRLGAGTAQPHHRAGALSRHRQARALHAISLAVLPHAFPVRDGQRAAECLRLLHDRLRAGPAQRTHGAPAARWRSPPATPLPANGHGNSSKTPVPAMPMPPNQTKRNPRRCAAVNPLRLPAAHSTEPSACRGLALAAALV